LIWQPLQPHLTNTNKIFYAPSGLLNKVPFYALLDNNNQYLGEQSNLHAMLSLRDLVKKDKDIPKVNKPLIALFGGADFDFGVQKDGEDNFMNDFLMSKPLSNLLSDNVRSGWAFLKGTLKEVEQIEAIAKATNNNSLKFSGEKASEENLKATIQEKKPQILHIATHGYYIPPPNEKPEQLAFASLNNENLHKNHDEPLLRSGILLSGANRKWVHKQSIDTPDDGIVTAMEISRMNMQNTELVVLSACETGLGDIKHTEGVMGLQRAFKMAGAKRQIISLWQVPDKATAEMMELFYTALLKENKDYRTAFNQAQSIMKSNYPEDPIKWAGFVLVE
jgi:CHAT domain-containing protein